MNEKFTKEDILSTFGMMVICVILTFIVFGIGRALGIPEFCGIW